ncbi:MAG: hypothetical protein HXY34_00865 [Candidatus Thorarchaeota archaeon]|nr:hypothetical protein [Candidatus Thorarchaeota archaeon]
MRGLLSRTTSSKVAIGSRDLADMDLHSLAENRAIPLSIREKYILELARRREPWMMQFCEGLLASADIEEWLLGVTALIAIGTGDAVERLFRLYNETSEQERPIVFEALGRTVSPEYSHAFAAVARFHVGQHRVDVENWTEHAIGILEAVSGRLAGDSHMAFQRDSDAEA